MKLVTFLRSILLGFSSITSFNAAPLYRHPYRNNQEGLNADFKHIGSDITAAINQGESYDG